MGALHVAHALPAGGRRGEQPVLLGDVPADARAEGVVAVEWRELALVALDRTTLAVVVEISRDDHRRGPQVGREQLRDAPGEHAGYVLVTRVLPYSLYPLWWRPCQRPRRPGRSPPPSSARPRAG